MGPCFADVSCQTDPMGSMDTYPNNLMYAQSMLALTMSQLNQVDTQIARLRGMLLEHQHAAYKTDSLGAGFAQPLMGAAAAAVSAACATQVVAKAPEASTSSSSTTPASTTAAIAAPQHGRPAPAADAPAPEGDANAAAAAVAAAAGAPAEEGGQLRIHRMRLAAAVKVALVMILMDLKAGWFFLYFFGVFLYVGGMFDPIIDFLSRGQRSQQSLEQQLTALRHRQRMAERREEARQQRAAALAAAAAAGEAGEGEGTASADGTSGEAAEGAVAASAEVEAEPEEPPRAPHYQRCVYQLVFMFFMTLMPWWTPNPYYL